MSNNALNTVRALNLMSQEEPPVAMCPSCRDEVLVLTFRWPGAEFYCLACKGHFGFLDPRPEKETPDLKARQIEVRASFKEAFPPVSSTREETSA